MEWKGCVPGALPVGQAGSDVRKASEAVVGQIGQHLSAGLSEGVTREGRVHGRRTLQLAQQQPLAGHLRGSERRRNG